MWPALLFFGFNLILRGACFYMFLNHKLVMVVKDASKMAGFFIFILISFHGRYHSFWYLRFFCSDEKNRAIFIINEESFTYVWIVYIHQIYFTIIKSTPECVRKTKIFFKIQNREPCKRREQSSCQSNRTSAQKKPGRIKHQNTTKNKRNRPKSCFW